MMKMERSYWSLLVLVFLLVASQLQSQIGGLNTYEFLNLNLSARSTALGGSAIAIVDQDVALAFNNPALLNDTMHSRLAFNQNFHFAGISQGTLNYGFHSNKLETTFHGGFHYISYGNFALTNEAGADIGTFKARELAFTAGASRVIGKNLRAGANIKLGSSVLESYRSLVWAVDIGGVYEIPDKSMTLAFVIKNIGTPISKFTEASDDLPLDMQLGWTKKLEHLPFRLSITAHHLNRWDIRYDDPTEPITGIFGEEVSQASGFSKGVDNFFRHIIFGGEFLFGKRENFQLRFAYNHQRRKELAVSQFNSFGGFSLGVGFKVKKIVFDYGIGYYHLAGAVNHLGIAINLSEFRKKI